MAPGADRQQACRRLLETRHFFDVSLPEGASGFDGTTPAPFEVRRKETWVHSLNSCGRMSAFSCSCS